MLSAESSWRLHMVQNSLLILLSLFFLPIDSLILFYSYCLRVLAPQDGIRRRIRRSRGFQPKTILVTGLGMSKGLALARMFYLAGHNVIGADAEPYGVPVNGRFSKALKEFYRLPKPSKSDGSAPYVQHLLKIVRMEKVDLWVSCSSASTAVEDGLAKEIIELRSDCKAVQFDVNTTATLHEKHSFIQKTIALGLPAPETYDVTTRHAVHTLLNSKPKKQYIMKSAGAVDAIKGNRILLPRRTVSETYNQVSTLSISKDKPWVLEQYIQGEEYCTHALVVNGEVKAFVACPSQELLMHYEALPCTSGLGKVMLKFTQEFVSRTGDGMTGHLSFDFRVEETMSESGLQMSLYPIECNPRAHTAVLLFSSLSPELAVRYMDALVSKTNGLSKGHVNGPVLMPRSPKRYYWIGHDLVSLVLHPTLQVLRLELSIPAFLRGCYTFLEHLLLWKDGTFELWDPLPSWWLYHVYWPGHLLTCMWQRRKWSRINISTTEMYSC